MTRFLHAGLGSLALALIALFWSATVLSELAGDPLWIARVKTAILWGMGVLVPCLIATAGSGHRLAGSSVHPAIVAKRRRMRLIALNGLLVLLPSALFLAGRAEAGRFDTVFVAVQAVELLAGATNLWLMGCNLRDGLEMRVRRPRPA